MQIDDCRLTEAKTEAEVEVEAKVKVKVEVEVKAEGESETRHGLNPDFSPPPADN